MFKPGAHEMMKTTRKDKDQDLWRKVLWLDPNQVILIGRDTEDTDRHGLFHPRAFRTYKESTVRTMLTHGIVEPIRVKRVDGQYIVVAGRGRVINAREALRRQVENGVEDGQLLKVPALLTRGSDQHAIAIASIENAHRTEETILERANNVRRLLAYGATEEEAADYMDVDPATIRGWISLLEADPEVVAAVRDERIAPCAAMPIAKLATREDQRTALAELLGSGKVSISEARRVAARKSGRAEPGLSSRRVLRRIRQRIAGAAKEEDYWQGFTAALDLVLGSGKLDARVKALVDQVTASKAIGAADGSASNDDAADDSAPNETP